MQPDQMVFPGSHHPSTSSTPAARWVLVLSIIFGSLVHTTADAGPWIDTGDHQTRHHLQVLADGGVLNTPITSWPLMWRHVKQALDDIEPRQLDADQVWSYQYVRHKLRRAMRPATFKQRASIGNTVAAVGDFSSTRRERYESELGINVTTHKTSLNLQAGYAHHPQDDDSLRFDGSHLSHLFGNWALGVGAVDRWWGPGWDSSLILSNEARPTPGIFLQRNSSHAFESPWLSWLGPWQLVTFMSQLESERAVADARLWGMRLNIRPLRSLEIGFSRTAMWGGEGRPQDLDTFLNLLLGKDNRGDGGINEDASNEPGNQLAGVDLRWGYNFAGYSGAIYGQLIGEDEAGGMPSRHIGMAGAEIHAEWEQTQVRFSLETQNTTVYFYKSDTMPDTAYEHSIYRSGYRYHGRPIGSSTDNDTEAYIMRSQIYFRDGDHLNLSLGKFRFNRDDGNAAAPGGSLLGAKTVTERIQASYFRPLNASLMLEAGIFHYTTPIFFSGRKIDSGGHLTLHASW